jgi:hypothetical protein
MVTLTGGPKLDWGLLTAFDPDHATRIPRDRPGAAPNGLTCAARAAPEGYSGVGTPSRVSSVARDAGRSA